ncbi:MAG: HPr(Ser) kinase/phosphatase [Oscillospiraceae bacterium]|nr:HPr(Ser) kinase/phosphatase [Lachnospiraceae bacterium]MBQ6428882.1 HPr(Ser) kinase/phosphatase [Oscillospiraceae bacterium]
MNAISLEQLAHELQLENLTPEIPLYDILIQTAEMNRPALQLTGFLEHFDPSRVQVIGLVEHTYVNSLEPEERIRAFERLFSAHIPCLILCRGFKPAEDVVTLALRYHVPILSSPMSTSTFQARIMRLLEVRLAPMVAIHGCLVDVFGEGVLMLGDSGVGKSETALELIKRGHRLVADDTVEIRRYSENELYGRAPEVTKYLMELRGIGVIDVKALYGVASVKDDMRISMVMKLESWDNKKIFDRLGMREDFVEYLGNKVTCYTVPMSAGRNSAVIVETAAINFRQKRMGYDAMQELERRLAEQMSRNRGE